jgi:hypothetical protein
LQFLIRGADEFSDREDVLSEFLRSPQKAIDLTRKNNVEGQNDQKYQQSVKDIDEGFVRYQISVISLKVFRNTDYRSDQNQDTGYVERVQVLAPHVCQF